MSRRHFVLLFALLAWTTGRLGAEHDGKIQILLLGDSTTIGSVCRQVEPAALHLEDVIQSCWRPTKTCRRRTSSIKAETANTSTAS